MRPPVATVMREQAFDGAARLHLAACVLDIHQRELRNADDRPVVLRHKALEVLLLLAEHAGHIVDKRTLMDRVWPGVIVGDDSLTQTIVEIRRALGDHERQVLCTVARRGYRLQPTEAPASVAAPALSIAVLPIAHDAADADSARWAAALTAELTSRVGAGLPDSKVVARETVAAMGAVLTDPRVVAQRLHVQQVVCGDMRAVAGGWCLALSMIDGATGTRRWSHPFTLAYTGLADQIGQVATKAARAIHVQMHRAAAEIAATQPADGRSAGDLAMQGWASIYDGISPGNLERAQHYFEQSVEKDPSHLRGLGGVCTSNFWRALLGWSPDRAQAQRSALDAASRLATLYPDEILTMMSRGSAAHIEQRWALRLSIGDRLCERDPANSTAHFTRGAALLRLGRFDECLTAFAEARRLSVDDFRAGWWSEFEACAHLMAGRYKPAALEAQRAIAANDCLPLPPLLLAAALAGDCRTGEGRDVLRQHRAREPRCDRAYAEMLLGHGEVAYAQGCARILSSLETLGMAGGLAE